MYAHNNSNGQARGGPEGGGSEGYGRSAYEYSRFPKFHRAFLGRDSGTLKSDIVSKKHTQLICSDSRLSN